MSDWMIPAVLVDVALAGACVWLFVQHRRLRLRLREATDVIESRTTDLESARIELQRLCAEDGLTAVANHERLLQFLEAEWRRARRESTPLALVLLDLDAFRSFNRQYGRRAGDDCLRQVARALAGLVNRAGDLVARYHRDAFAIVLPTTDRRGALHLAERIRAGVEDLRIPSANGAPEGVLTASVAVACTIPERQSPWEELDLITAASHAVKEAHAAGGNRVQAAAFERIAAEAHGTSEAGRPS